MSLHGLLPASSTVTRNNDSLEAVTQHQQQGQALALLVGTGRRLGGLHKQASAHMHAVDGAVKHRSKLLLQLHHGLLLLLLRVS